MLTQYVCVYGLRGHAQSETEQVAQPRRIEQVPVPITRSGGSPLVSSSTWVSTSTGWLP